MQFNSAQRKAQVQAHCTRQCSASPHRKRSAAPPGFSLQSKGGAEGRAVALEVQQDTAEQCTAAWQPPASPAHPLLCSRAGSHPRMHRRLLATACLPVAVFATCRLSAMSAPVTVSSGRVRSPVPLTEPLRVVGPSSVAAARKLAAPPTISGVLMMVVSPAPALLTNPPLAVSSPSTDVGPASTVLPSLEICTSLLPVIMSASPGGLCSTAAVMLRPTARSSCTAQAGGGKGQGK